MLRSMRILVIEDDPKIASFVVNGLKQSGFAVDHCGWAECVLQGDLYPAGQRDDRSELGVCEQCG